MKKMFIRPTAALLLLLPLVSCSDSKTGEIGETEVEPVKEIALSRAQLEDVADLTDFSFRLFDRAASVEEANENLSISPVGVSMLLGMMANGVEGETRAELLGAMFGNENVNIDELNDLMTRLITELPSVDAKVDVKLANSVWYQDRINPTDGFKSAMTGFYKADVALVDLKSNEAKAIINNWANKATSGIIPEVYDTQYKNYSKVTPDFISFSLMCFDGRWSIPFDKSKTRPAKFYNADGTVAEVEMMDDSECHYKLVATEDYYSVTRPYGNHAFAIDLILPAEGKTIADVRARFADDGWQSNMQILSRSDSQRSAGIKIPKFDTSSSWNVSEVLTKDFGVDKLFELSEDFYPIASTSSRVMQIGQKVNLSFDEEGTKATAITQTGLDTASSPSTVLVFNRPFMYVIYEQSTGAVLLVGTIDNL